MVKLAKDSSERAQRMDHLMRSNAAALRSTLSRREDVVRPTRVLRRLTSYSGFPFRKFIALELKKSRKSRIEMQYTDV